MTASINLSRIAQAYNAIRDARTVKRHAWEAEDLALEQDQDKLKVVMLEMLNQIGGKSINTEHGTVIRSRKVKPSVPDWNAFYDWVLGDKERFEALEKRIKSTFVRDYMEENDGQLPPGVAAHVEYEVSVRRANGAKSDDENR